MFCTTANVVSKLATLSSDVKQLSPQVIKTSPACCLSGLLRSVRENGQKTHLKHTRTRHKEKLRDLLQVNSEQSPEDMLLAL